MAIETLTMWEEEKSSMIEKEIGKIGGRPLCGKSALRGVAAFIWPQKAAEVGLLLEKDQDFMASLICHRRGCSNT